MKKINNKKLKKKILYFILILISIMSLSFLIYTSIYYKADYTANKILENNKNIEIIDNLTVLKAKGKSDKGLIFYPGGKVEAKAYLPILESLQDKGINCILVEMPFNLAVFNYKAADRIYDLFPEINQWYIGGHSLGGAMASKYAGENKSKIEGLILLGAYIYGDYPSTKALTIYGTFNSNLEKNISYKDNIVVIEGGNHAQFGNYGKQLNDPYATISREKQQKIAVDEILKFINKLN
ncbi:MAG: alpha/beta hydrolase [Peptoniphilaceae bacterium]